MTDWISLGLAAPTFNNWLFFPAPSFGGTFFKVRFIGIEGYDRYFRTFVVIAPVWVRAQEVIRMKGKRFYPSRDEEVVEFSFPAELIEAGEGVREFSIRRFFKRPYIGRSGEPNYRVEMLDWTNDAPPIDVGGGGSPTGGSDSPITISGGSY